MDRKYIKGFVFALVCITQFMQCTVLTKGLHMGNCMRIMGMNPINAIKKAGQAQQEYIKLLCVDFYSLFKQAKGDVEDCVNIHLPKSLTASTTWNTKYRSDDYFIISFGNIKADKNLLWS
ncbi:MAG: hypothetical protein NMK33_00390 [Candidatus Cardinium sp.]|uniref:hypothetical protein n=1 Tax=Cardinium endosymbiont of Dermatophagoides farinae TaxID=2597823 RepID=UPI00118379D8|nr:hypothetical protein [Cardinium endosymbiont of Dermatophagoides farinae]TSJ80990.1 hypothetical protein FPG78_03070 [Cardinium endosymbiont of Dermatophagoides farinae]UWW97016.1 MAG: hypothetical protein NMK33_00390 [Candidatus Cardinium sp.]